ncbi:glycoside hydrolase superfamily [Xylariales sp. AK1849]|nr:glycoside hydrolase superfamily [Xylariales sp. AK1849]
MSALSLIIAGLATHASAVWLAGVNIAGCDIGMDTSGNYDPADAWGGQYGCPTGAIGTTQMQHFADKDNFNVFRLPVTWQSLVGNDLETNKLNDTFWTTYSGIVQNCLDTGAHCIIDIHNYARWWDEIVGQGGPESSALATTWSQIATKYADNPQVIFGIMNEPHDLDIGEWSDTLQAVVTAIREATGNTNHMIFLGGTNYASASSFQYDSGPTIKAVANPDGSTTNLIFEVHQYFDGAGGTTTSCTVDTSSQFGDLATYLRSIGRQAFVGELGGGNGDDCISIICSVLDVLNANADVFLGWTSWAAGNWPDTYELNEMPDGDTDVGIVASCFAPKFNSG